MEKAESTFSFQSKEIPTDPGCYLFYDEDDTILYVGKAKNLRKRVSNYFQKNQKSPKTASLVKKIQRIETRVVKTEMEALILENNLIKKHQPRYNILLRDDKNFLYLRITNETFPRLEITRRIVRDGSFYLGPKTSAKKFRETIAFCQKVFQIRTCKLEFETPSSNSSSEFELKITKNPENRKIPCLDFHIKKCSGPCAGYISPEEYQADILRMKKFLRGDTKEVIQNLQEKMMTAAKEKNFEHAAKLRDLMQSIEASTTRQTVQFTDLIDRDFVSFVREGRSAFFVRVAFRNGKFLDQNEVQFRAEDFSTDAEVLEQFLLQFYDRVDALPAEIYIPEEIENQSELEAVLAEKFPGESAKIFVPQRGEKRQALDIAKKNAQKFADQFHVQELSEVENFTKALPELATALGMKASPRRIECYDISHFAGTQTVASQVVFVDGKPKKSEYRRFHVKSLKPGEIDDFKSMKEVLERRFRAIDNAEERPQTTEDKKWENENKGLLKKWTELQTLLEGLDYWLLGGLACAFACGKLWRKHEDFDLIIAKKHWKKFEKILLENEWEKKEKAENIFTFTRKGWPDMDASALGNETPYGIWKKSDCDEEVAWIGKISAPTLKITSLLTLKEKLQEMRENSNDAEDIESLQEEIEYRHAQDRIPDLVVIDGGKGQLSSVLKVIPKEFHDKVISLAKREEEVFIPGHSHPIELSSDSAASKLLQRLRDEAHRFAISFNRNLRTKALTKSALDEITGIGPTTKKKLLTTFGSVSGVRGASDAQLLTILNAKQLANIRKNL